MICLAAPRALPAAAKRALTIMLIAKHVHWEGGLHPTDGTHATYHREMRAALEQIANWNSQPKYTLGYEGPSEVARVALRVDPEAPPQADA